jgi:hypothetical protein
MTGKFDAGTLTKTAAWISSILQAANSMPHLEKFY